jgi:hypothetical protein
MEETIMRAEVRPVVRQLKCGWWMLLVLALVACATSPTDQLTRAESMLVRLESNGADAYLRYELATARRKLEEARKLVRKNRFELASQYLNSVCQMLDSCGVAFLQLRQHAQQQCQQQVLALSAGIDTLRNLVTTLPRQSYIDQNRYDIYTHRLRRYRDEMEILQKLLQKEEFPTALQRGAKLEFQVRHSLMSLLETTDVGVKLVSRPGAVKERVPMVAATSRSGSR